MQPDSQSSRYMALAGAVARRKGLNVPIIPQEVREEGRPKSAKKVNQQVRAAFGNKIWNL